MRELVVVRHRPGSRWDDTLGYRDQPGIEQHVSYWSTVNAAGAVFMGGPFPDNSGGMMILAVSEAEADPLVAQDPAVVTDLLRAEVRLWRVVLEGPANRSVGMRR